MASHGIMRIYSHGGDFEVWLLYYKTGWDTRTFLHINMYTPRRIRLPEIAYLAMFVLTVLQG